MTGATEGISGVGVGMTGATEDDSRLGRIVA